MKKEKATIEDFARMCNKNSAKCDECPFALINNGKGGYCYDLMRRSPDEASEIILKWCEEHPVKTRQEKFLEMFPNASIDTHGVLVIYPCKLEKEAKCRSKHCEECRRNYWSEEVEE